MDKKAVSQIITTILIILLVLATIVIVWNVVKKTVEEKTEEVDIGIITTQLDIKKASVVINYFSDTLTLTVSRGADSSNISSLKFVVYGQDLSGNIITKTYERNRTDIPNALESKTYELDITDFKDNSITKISVYPVSQKGKTGTEESYIITEETTSPEEPEPPCANGDCASYAEIKYVNAGESIQNVIDNITDASAEKRYLIKIAYGVFNEQVHCKDYIDLKGEGMYNTTIRNIGSVDNNFSTIFPANNTKISDITIEATGIGIGIGNYGHPELAGINYSVENCRIIANYDLVYSTQPYNVITVKNCIGYSQVDGFTILMTDYNKYYIYNTHIYPQNKTEGIFKCGMGATNSKMYIYNSSIEGTMNLLGSHKIVNAECMVKLYDVEINVTFNPPGDGTKEIQGVSAIEASSNVELFNGSVHVSCSDCPAYDLHQNNYGNITVHGTKYSTSRGIINIV